MSNCRREIQQLTIPFSNDSQSIEYDCLVSSSTNVPTRNAKSLIPLLGGGVLVKEQQNLAR